MVIALGGGRKANDLVNQRFGRLVVVAKTDKRQGHEIIWQCLCDCGNTVFAAGGNLKSGHTKSCGCLRKDTGTENGKNMADNIAGQRFGKLIAINPTSERKGTNIVWKCQCDCGNIIYATAINLRRGDTQSCGCVKDSAFQANREKAGFIEGTCVALIKSKKQNPLNTSGHKGVSWSKSQNKWLAYITFKRKRHNLGGYAKIEKAIAAREKAENIYFKDFLDRYENEHKNSLN